METIQKIKAILESRNMSQSDLAREAEIEHKEGEEEYTLRRYENLSIYAPS